jgi:hypothetical protein
MTMSKGLKGQNQTLSETPVCVTEIATGRREEEFKSEEPKNAVLRTSVEQFRLPGSGSLIGISSIVSRALNSAAR